MQVLTATSVDLRAEGGEALKIQFQESNVDKVIISAAESLPPGSFAVVSHSGPSYIQLASSTIPLHRCNGALWMKLWRTTQQEESPAITIAAASSSGPQLRTPEIEQMEIVADPTSRSSGEPRPAPENEIAAEAAEPDAEEQVSAKELPYAAFLSITDESLEARARGIPILPSLGERAAHRLTHFPFRAWCVWCVYGRGKEDPHKRNKDRKSDIPVVGLDYCFPSFASGAMITVLIITEVFSGAVEAVMVSEKGPSEFPVRSVIRQLRVWGLARVALWSDQEPAIKALVAAIQTARKEETSFYEGKRYDPKGKGAIENMCGLVTGLLRTFVLSVEHHYKTEMKEDHPLLPWLVRHTGWVLTRFAVKSSGLTPYRQLRGRDYNGVVVEIGECMLYKKPIAPKLVAQFEK